MWVPAPFSQSQYGIGIPGRIKLGGILTIWPSLAIFLISITSFFSWFCRPVRSRSSSRIDRSSRRLFSRSSSGQFKGVAIKRDRAYCAAYKPSWNH